MLKIASCILAAVLLVACAGDDHNSASPATGTLSVALSVRQHMLAPDGSATDIPVPVLPVSEATALTIADAGGEYAHTWPSFDTFPQAQEYLTGSYAVSARWEGAEPEGFDTTPFAGTEMTIVAEGELCLSTVHMTMTDAGIKTDFGQTDDARAALLGLDFVSPSGRRFRIEPGEERMLCVAPGDSRLYASLQTAGGSEPFCLDLGTASMPAEGTLYTFGASLTGGQLRVSGQGVDYSLPLDRLDNLRAPSLQASPMIEGGEITLPEGEAPSAPCTLTATPGSAPLSHLYLSTSSASLSLNEGYPATADLLHLTPAEQELFASLGFNPEIRPDGSAAAADLSPLMEKLIYLEGQTPLTVFSLTAVGADGLASEPYEVRVETTPVEISITVPAPAVMGIDRATLRARCASDNFARHVDVRLAGAGSPLLPVEVTPVSAGVYDVSFDIGKGSTPVEVEVLYCDEVRQTVKVERVMPHFTIEADTYSREAAIRVNVADPSLASLIPVITERLYVYVDGRETPVYERWPQEGILHVIGLEPSTAYTFKATMMERTENDTRNLTFTPTVKGVTEGTPQLPNADFEERMNGVIYPDLPSGGRYSQTTVEIFNWQHHTSYSQEVPKGWSNTNAKTFCTKASNHNTWYMQPSASLTRTAPVSGSFVVELTTVGFDLNGEEIPDYAQTGQPYLDYSPVVPRIAYRAAGKLFLGNYSFNPATMEETYREGIPFSARPRSLNGYYRFMPSQANRSAAGLAKVEVIGRPDGVETVIASGKARLTFAADNTAFSVPLVYNMFGVKATAIKVMFSSSDQIGTIEEETAAIQTFPDPHTATATGGRLWIDNISLAY